MTCGHLAEQLEDVGLPVDQRGVGLICPHRAGALLGIQRDARLGGEAQPLDLGAAGHQVQQYGGELRIVHRLVHRLITAGGHPGVPEVVGQVAARPEQELVAFPGKLTLVDLDNGVYQPRIRAGEIGRAQRNDRVDRTALTAEPALLGQHRRERVGDVGDQIHSTNHASRPMSGSTIWNQ